MGLVLVTPPATEPLSVEEVRGFLRIDDTDSDVQILNAIKAVRAEVDGVMGWVGIALVSQIWDWTLDAFPWDGCPLQVPFPPLQSVTSITYVDPDGATQTWAPADYQVDGKAWPGRIAPAFGKTYPSTRAVLNAVTVRFVAGYATSAAIPDDLKQGLKEKIAQAFEERAGVVIGAGVAVLPGQGDARLMRYRVGGVG